MAHDGANVATVTRPVALQSPPKPAGRLAGDEGVWFFITADVTMFAIFFAVFMEGRYREPALFETARRHLEVGFGLANTLILLTSSWFMARAVHAARKAERRGTIVNLSLCILIGSGFAVSKWIEYGHKIASGIGLTTNEFFTYYFAFTGIHFLHFLIGIVLLGMMLARAFREEIGSTFRVWLESVGCYWHMVDLLWIVLFPMLYLMRAA